MAKFQKAMTWILIASLMMFIILGFTKIQNPIFDFSAPDFFLGGQEGVFTAALLLFSSTTGYFSNMNYGPDCKNATRDIPWSMMMTVPIIAVLYCGVSAIAAGVLPISQVADQPLTLVAQSILPLPLFYVFIIGGALGALFTTANGALANVPYAIAQSCKDGWLPKAFADKNKAGAYWKILTFIYLSVLIPLILNLDISAMVSAMMLFNSSMAILDILAYFRLPSKYPDAWAKSRLHISNSLYYIILVASGALNLFIIFRSLKTLTPALAGISLGLMAVCAVYIFFCARKKDMVIYTSMWAPSEDEHTA